MKNGEIWYVWLITDPKRWVISFNVNCFHKIVFLSVTISDGDCNMFRRYLPQVPRIQSLAGWRPPCKRWALLRCVVCCSNFHAPPSCNCALTKLSPCMLNRDYTGGGEESGSGATSPPSPSISTHTGSQSTLGCDQSDCRTRHFCLIPTSICMRVR